MIKGQIVGGDFSRIVIRQKVGSEIELGELLVADRVLLQVYDLEYASQLSQENIELVSGMHIEEDTEISFMDDQLRNYTRAAAKILLDLDNKLCKRLPAFLSEVRQVTEQDLSFLQRPNDPLFIGNLRSGSRAIEVPIYLSAREVLSHHILIPATTGRGKSNLMSCMLWDLLDKPFCGILILDPHDEYYGRSALGLKDHPARHMLEYYSCMSPPPGTRTLRVNLRLIKPGHFNGAIDWSEAQREGLHHAYRKWREEWILSIVMGKAIENFSEATLNVIRRRLMQVLDLSFDGQRIFCHGFFSQDSGMTTIEDIISALSSGRKVIVDTSSVAAETEILLGSIITSEVFYRNKRLKMEGTHKDRPVISILLEEAPRVLGSEVLKQGSNIFATIAREGRKFGVGLTAITQLPSLIPRQILANMNTKIVLGLEMAPERSAIIDSASQDLSNDSRSIASLDKGEAIVTSNFARFALPVKIPLFSDFAQKDIKKAKHRTEFSGMKIG